MRTFDIFTLDVLSYSAMMQVVYARRGIRAYGRDRRPWSSLYMNRRNSDEVRWSGEGGYFIYTCVSPNVRLSKAMRRPIPNTSNVSQRDCSST